ncbi:MAG TPA: gamma-glutamyl-gamma-aminobutyrate hydrolase family protein [Ktedonobacterales bacterium]
MSESRGGGFPLVGVPCFSGELAETHRPIYGNNRAYIRALIAAGVTPLLIPPELDASALEEVCAQLNGLVLAGGADVDPAHYGEQRSSACGDVEPERDELELTLTRMALSRDLPTLGICRGMQVMNVACGGSLYQDIPTERPDAQVHDQHHLGRNHLAHSIHVERESRLGAILGVTETRVNSLHHQAVDRTGTGLRIVARAEDGLPEGIEAPDRRFAVAVQYHPEELVETDALSRRLFAAFAEACRSR